MISKPRFISVLLAVIFVGGIAQAQAADVKIGFVDTSVLLKESPQSQHATDEMTKKFDSRRKELMSEQEKIKSLQDQLNKNGAVMSSAQLQDSQSQLDELQRDFSRKSSDYQDDVNMEKTAQLGKLQQAVIKAVQEFAQAQKYNMIIADAALYHDTTVDVTQQVLAQMEKDFKAESSKSDGN